MENITNIINWIITHKLEIAQVWAYVIAIATILVQLLPVLPENSKLLPLVKFVGKFLALNKNITERPK